MNLIPRTFSRANTSLNRWLNLCDSETRVRLMSWERSRVKSARYRQKFPERDRARKKAWLKNAVDAGYFRSGGRGYECNQASKAKRREQIKAYNRDYYMARKAA